MKHIALFIKTLLCLSILLISVYIVFASLTLLSFSVPLAYIDMMRIDMFAVALIFLYGIFILLSICGAINSVYPFEIKNVISDSTKDPENTKKI
jgi:hypothetical protein